MRVLVTGAGGGASTFLVQIAHALGAEVAVTSSSDDKIERAIELGAARGVRYTDPGWPSQVGEVDLVVDSAGAPAWPGALDCLRRGGTLVSFGRTGGVSTELEIPRLFYGQWNLLGTTMGSPREFDALLAHVRQARLAPGRGQRVPAGRGGGSARTAGAARPVRQGGAGMSLHLTQIAPLLRRRRGAERRVGDRAAARPRGAGGAQRRRQDLAAADHRRRAGAGRRHHVADRPAPAWRCTTSGRRCAAGVTLGDYVGEGAAAAAELEADLRRIERRMAERRRRRGHAAPTTEPPRPRSSGPAATPGGRGWRRSSRGLGFTPGGPGAAAGHVLGRRADAGLADARRWPASPTCCCWTSPPTTSTSTRSSGWRSTWTGSTRRSSSSRTTAGSWSRWPTSVLELERGKGRMTKGSYSHWRLRAGRADGRRRPTSTSASSRSWRTCSGSSTASATARKSRQAQSKLKAMATDRAGRAARASSGRWRSTSRRRRAAGGW